MGQVYHLQEKKNLESFLLRSVTVGSELHPSGSKPETLGVSRWRRGAPYCLSPWTLSRMDVCMCKCGWRSWHTHALHLSQLTLRICLRGTSPPRPIHQLGPNTPCATVDTGLTTWHWQRWARPAAEWRLRQKERWIGLWSTFNLNYCKYFHLAENWVHYVYIAGQVRVTFPAFDQNYALSVSIFHGQFNRAEVKTSGSVLAPDLVLTSEY